MATTKFAQSLSRDLKEKLEAYGFTVTASDGSSGDPMLLIGTGATTTQTALVRIVPEVSLESNSVGIAQTVYCPHKVQVALENNAGGAVGYLSIANFAKILPLLTAPGAKLEVYSVITADMPLNEADFTGGSTVLVASIFPNIYNPLTAQS